jgi:hypothetical protein
MRMPRAGIFQKQQFPHRVPLEVENGIVVVGGDAHFWPDNIPFMHRALIKMLNRFRQQKKLRAVIMNGDMTDFPAISRWPLVNWEKQPTPQEEIEFTQDRMHEISMAAGKVPKFWPAGNHDIRYNMFLAKNVPQMAGIQGMHLKDFYPDWQACWSVMINEDVFVKHRFKGGIHAAYNNIQATGVHTITNHLHSAKVTPVTKMRGTLWGVDCGCLAEVSGPQFLYIEDNVRDWREAFCVLSFHDGNLMPPELVLRSESDPDCIIFRGELIQV